MVREARQKGRNVHVQRRRERARVRRARGVRRETKRAARSCRRGLCHADERRSGVSHHGRELFFWLGPHATSGTRLPRRERFCSSSSHWASERSIGSARSSSGAGWPRYAPRCRAQRRRRRSRDCGMRLTKLYTLRGQLATKYYARRAPSLPTSPIEGLVECPKPRRTDVSTSR